MTILSLNCRLSHVKTAIAGWLVDVRVSAWLFAHSWNPLRRLQDSMQLFSSMAALRVLGHRKESAEQALEPTRSRLWTAEDVAAMLRLASASPGTRRHTLRILASPHDRCDELDAPLDYLFHFVNDDP